ncbi:DUF882 domain-containing protein [Methylobacterium oryzihabitans]|uniref:Murein endopeptidase K n=1 Tax=Methylobacterium oryzihabitans TaxID=2499852 RepID=A0A437PCA0_9HYPH|nr:DUF882 domain-containing protein [Methylobacterium oryzihabitans]RVU19860.1 DUF882 domain-containing protein [Methylobacterium oryzihabitans]
MRAVLRASRASARSSRQAPRDRRSRSLVVLALAAVAVAGGARGTQDAAANGDTRTLSIFHEHTKESLTVTFKRDGRYDRAVLEQLNWLLRDWRIDEPTKMDPRLFDVVWEAHRATGSRDAVHVVSAYRSPQTNAALRRRSRAVAEHSQHMLGKAMDFYLGDVSVDQIRQIGMQMQRGGVGWYPHAYNPFVHLDVGSVRSWPRMPGDQLARLFPDGRTVHLPADGRPLPGYELAKAEILSRGGTVAGITQVAAAEEEDSPNFVRQLFSALFGGGNTQQAPAPAPTALAARGRPSRPRPVALASADPDDAGSRAALAYAADPRAALVPEAAPAAAPPPEPTTTGARAEPADAVPEAPAPAVAGPASAGLKAPLPPRRPSEFAALAHALVAAPLPQVRSGPATQVATADPAALPGLLPARPRAVAASPAPAPSSTDPKAHLRALFAAAVAQTASAGPARLAQTRATPQGAPPKGLVATPAGEVATRFQSTAGDEAETGRFSGAAVKPPPVLRR